MDVCMGKWQLVEYQDCTIDIASNSQHPGRSVQGKMVEDIWALGFGHLGTGRSLWGLYQMLMVIQRLLFIDGCRVVFVG